MGKFYRILNVVFFASLSALQAYESIDEALENGISNGDIVIYGSSTNVRGTEILGSDLSNNGYGVGSIGLAYRSGFYKSWRFMISFRASADFYQADKNSIWRDDINSPGRTSSALKGDSARDFYAPTMLGQSYLEYFDGDTSLRVGRIFAKSEWADRLIDGVWLRNKSLTNTLIEVFWAKSSGYVQYNKMSGLVNVNPYNDFGLLNASIKYTFNDILSLKGYGIFAPSVFNAVGAKVAFRYEVSNSYIGANAHFTTSFEGSNSPYYNRALGANGFVFDTRAYIGVKDFIGNMRNGLELSGGFLMSGVNGIGSLNAVGNNVSPFFMWGGRAFLLGSDASLGFGKINFSIDRISLALVYGSTRFSTPYGFTQGGFDRVNEVNLLLEFGLSEHTSFLFNLLNTHAGKKLYYPHTTALNFGLKLAF
ncbi:Opr family porin [Helicobacter himalayensis]|uniref:Opr family porin n=1 Tax=Helicobacter himalayensis TaxID=1591088 RepID=UPI003D6E69EB